jgi:hypothetical protein
MGQGQRTSQLLQPAEKSKSKLSLNRSPNAFFGLLSDGDRSSWHYQPFHPMQNFYHGSREEAKASCWATHKSPSIPF